MSVSHVSCSAIDVGIIIYNEREIIEKALEPLLAAGFDSFVVLDMHSTDGTRDYVQQKLGDKVKIIDFPRRSLLEYGYAEARNTCAVFSTREWLLFVDADEVLIGGTTDGKVLVESEGNNPALFSIKRNNLACETKDGAETIVIRSVENHNRLYKPSIRMRYAGYIHEEIHIGETSGWQDNGKTGLVFDHYSNLKPVRDAELKAGLYAVMLLRAYNQPDVRRGTNPWWFDHYVPTHMAATQAQAEKFAIRERLPTTFFGPDPFLKTETIVRNLVPSRVTAGDQPEATFQMEVLRALHSAPVGAYTGQPARALWGEWNHPGEGSRTLTSIIESTKSFHWDRFIKPGQVAIDIGGHSGDTAIPMALFSYDKANARRGTVVVVEPNPAVVPVLNVNLALNTHLGDFYSLMAAVTAEDVAEIELADHGNSECNGGVLDSGRVSVELKDRLQAAAGVTYRAAGISLESLFTRIHDNITRDPVGFIKIDCEGYDKEILRPCRELFALTKPVLFVEWFNWFTPQDDQDLFDVIASIDYVPFDPLTLERATLDHKVSDVLCVHKDRSGLIETLR